MNDSRDKRIIAILHQARDGADWARNVAAATPFLDTAERERVRRVLVLRLVREHLAPIRVSQPLAIGVAIARATLATLGILATQSVMALATGLFPHMYDRVTLGFIPYPVPLSILVFQAMATGMVLAIHGWGSVLTDIKQKWRENTRISPLFIISTVLTYPRSAVALGFGLPGLAEITAIVSTSDWGAHGRNGIALVCGLVAGLSGKLWIRTADRAASTALRANLRLVQGDRALLAIAVCVDRSTQMLEGLWRRPGAVKEFRLEIDWWAALAQRSRIAFGKTRWFEWRVRAQYRRRYRMLAAIIRSHGSAALAATTAADWEKICQSLVSGMMLVVDKDWDAVIAAYASLPHRDRWIARVAPRLLTAAVTGCGAVFLPLLPGLGGTAGSSVRVFLGIAAVLALLPAGEGYDPVRSAVSSSLPWRGGSK